MKKQLIDMKALLIVGSCLLLAACTGRTSQSGTEEKPVITVTLEPQRYFTEAIAGDKAQVKLTMGGKTQTIAEMNRAAKERVAGDAERIGEAQAQP